MIYNWINNNPELFIWLTMTFIMVGFRMAAIKHKPFEFSGEFVFQFVASFLLWPIYALTMVGQVIYHLIIKACK